MGAWRSIRHRLEEAAAGVPLRYVGRPWRASPSEGYPTAHLIEQDRIARDALTCSDGRSALAACLLRRPHLLAPRAARACRAWAATQRRWVGDSRRQTSQAVSAMPIGPTACRIGVRGIGAIVPRARHLVTGQPMLARVSVQPPDGAGGGDGCRGAAASRAGAEGGWIIASVIGVGRRSDRGHAGVGRGRGRRRWTESPAAAWRAAGTPGLPWVSEREPGRGPEQAREQEQVGAGAGTGVGAGAGTGTGAGAGAGAGGTRGGVGVRGGVTGSGRSTRGFGTAGTGRRRGRGAGQRVPVPRRRRAGASASQPEP